MLTSDNLLYVFGLLESAGVRRPESLTHPDEDRSVELLERSAEVYAAVLADLSVSDLQGAVLGWLREGPAFWPAAGELRKMVPARRLEAADDGEDAWLTTKRYCRTRGRDGSPSGYREPVPGDLDAADAARDERMRFALSSIGGSMGFGRGNEKDEPHVARRFKDAYRNHKAQLAIGADLGALLAPLLLERNRKP